MIIANKFNQHSTSRFEPGTKNPVLLDSLVKIRAQMKAKFSPLCIQTRIVSKRIFSGTDSNQIEGTVLVPDLF